MIRKDREYANTRFSEDVVRAGASAFRSHTPLSGKGAERLHLTVEVDGAKWHHDSEEEFFADYRRSARGAVFQLERPGGQLRLHAFGDSVLGRSGRLVGHRLRRSQRSSSRRRSVAPCLNHCRFGLRSSWVTVRVFFGAILRTIFTRSRITRLKRMRLVPELDMLSVMSCKTCSPRAPSRFW